MVYENVGNVSEIYVHIPREVRPHGLVTHPSLVLKLYELHKQDRPLRKNLIPHSREFLLGEIEKGNIMPFLGLGFAILSEDMLNVARWNTAYPIVLNNQIYEYEDGDLSTARPLDIRNAGAFCIWELGIVNHERIQWKSYLESRRTEEDKIKYLQSTLEGIL